VNNGGDSRNRLIVPRSTARSVIFNCAAAAEGFTRMPPIGSSVTDPDGLALLAEWIWERLPGQEDYAAWRAVRFAGRPENRSWQLECSAELGGWRLWEGGANHGLPAAGGPAAVRVPYALPREFFRVRFPEN